MHTDDHGNACRIFTSHGDGAFRPEQFRTIGDNVIFEKGVRVFHPEHISIGNNVYAGHGCYLKAYYKNSMSIGDNVWIGQEAFLHAGGGIVIEDGVGIGPYAKILTISHIERGRDEPVLYAPQRYQQVVIEYGTDIGIGAIVLPGVRIGRNSIVGAGSVVTRTVAPYSVVAGSPAREIRNR